MNPSSIHRLAWDGIAFETPAEWDLAYQDNRNGIVRIRLEDDVAVRLSAEWMRPAGALDLGRITARFKEVSRALDRAAKNAETLSALPDGWSAVLYRFPDGRQLALAFFLAPAGALFAFFQFHLDPGPSGEALALLRAFMASFVRYDPRGPLPWACYDVAFVAPPGFALTSAAFHPGLKRFTFGRALRRLHCWHVSLADLVLKNGTSTAEWAARFLNGQELVRGPVFTNRDGALRATRPGLLTRCHFLEVGRACFRYKAAVRHEPDANRLVLTCYQYRRESDLAWLAGTDLPVSGAGAPG